MMKLLQGLVLIVVPGILAFHLVATSYLAYPLVGVYQNIGFLGALLLLVLAQFLGFKCMWSDEG